MTKKKKKAWAPKPMSLAEMIAMIRLNLTVRTAGNPRDNILWIAVGPYGSYTKAAGYQGLLEVFGSDERPELKRELDRYVPQQPKGFRPMRPICTADSTFPGMIIGFQDVYLADSDEPLTASELAGLNFQFYPAVRDMVIRANRLSTPMAAANAVRKTLGKVDRDVKAKLEDKSLTPQERLQVVKNAVEDGRAAVQTFRGIAADMKETADAIDEIEKISNGEASAVPEEVPVEIEATVTPADEGGVFPDGQPMPEIHPEVTEPIEVKPASPEAENEEEDLATKTLAEKEAEEPDKVPEENDATESNQES